MNEQLVNEFIKRALHSGIPQEKVAMLVSKAQEIEFRNSPQKAAQAQLDTVVTNLLNEAGFDKNASSVNYVHGILKEALDNKCSSDTCIKVAKLALAKTRDNLQTAEKLAAISKNAELADYADGFIKAATSRGYSEEYATKYVINLIENEKRAFGPGGMEGQPPAPPAGGMFKQPMPDPSSLSGGGSGGPGGPGGMPGGPEGQIDPQLIQQLLALISGGQGGGQGPAAGLAQQ